MIGLPAGHTVARGPVLADYAAIVGDADLAALRALARPLQGARVRMIHGSTVPGSAAEILLRIVPLLTELGLECRREVLAGPEPYQALTN
ncbi:MAG TPA: hypothetical protein VLT86_11830, partial [Vicinamibacterales bacterium]|nr:hypothetical protein [Vicinamibacterales bacterium]